MTTFDVALMIATDAGDRPVVATVSSHTRVRELAMAAGGTATTTLARLGERLDPDSTLGDLGVRAGDTLRLGDAGSADWKRLGPELRVIGGVGAGLRRRVSEAAFVIGRGEGVDVVLTSRSVSRRHAEFEWRGDSFTARDLGSRHGTWIDGRRLSEDEVATVPPYTAVLLGDSVVTIAWGAEPSPLARTESRVHAVAPPRPAERRGYAPFLVPSAGAVGLAAAAAGVPPAIAIAATPTALVAGFAIDRALNARAQRRADTARARELESVAQAVRTEAARLATDARATYADPATLLSSAERRAPSLWVCSSRDLSLRVGLATARDAVSVALDEGGPRELRDAAASHLTPATVGLSGSVAVVGPEAFLDDVFVWLVVQAVAACHPDELEILVVSDDVDRWAWTALLPHTRSKVVVSSAAATRGLPDPERTARLVVVDRSSVHGLRADDFVLLRADVDGARRRQNGVVVSATSPGRVAIVRDGVAQADVLADVIDDPLALGLSIAMHLAAYGGQGGAARALPARVRLPDVIPAATDAAAIARGWRRASDALVAVIGVDEDGPVALSLEGAMSHVLVAGTTGAGKTRLLETIALGLAVNYAPTSLNLLTIDFKGGNELAGLSRLPHCVGAVSDRDAVEVDRAIAALTRELARRDEQFASVGATDRDDFVSRSGQPMPHLVVVADEFGQFRREDAAGSRVAALLRIAAQGRSKGVHLILGTQSPSIDVTSEIRQNVGVRLCLRVAEAAESVAVLGTTDAAQLVQPGRVVVSAGDRSRVVQAALSRGPVAPGDAAHNVIVRELVDVASGRVVESPELPGELFDAIVDAVAIAAGAEGYDVVSLLGPSLPTQVARAALPCATGSWTTQGLVFAQRDRPGVLAPPPLAFDLRREGACTIIGGPRSGRTTALLALAEAARDQSTATEPIVVHTIDWGSSLEPLAGADADGGVVAYRDFEHLRRMIRFLRGDGVAGVTRLLLIDRLDALQRDLRELDGGALSHELVDALQTGPRRGLFSAVTLDPVSLVGAGPQLGGLRVVLPVEDPTLSSAAGLPKRGAALPGRAVALPDGDDVQIGMAAAPPRALQDAPGRCAPLPTRVALDELRPATAEQVLLGIGGDELLDTFAVDLDRIGPTVVVIGRTGSGRSNALHAMASSYRGARALVQDPSDWIPANSAPSLVIVDDAARATASAPWLTDPELPDTLRAGGHVLIAAFDQADVQGLGFSHWLMRRPSPGLLLSLDATSDRIVAGERVGFHPPTELRAGPQGRGWWCERGRGTPVQVAAAALD